MSEWFKSVEDGQEHVKNDLRLSNPFSSKTNDNIERSSQVEHPSVRLSTFHDMCTEGAHRKIFSILLQWIISIDVYWRW